MEQNIFEVATRNKLRFPSTRGELTVEQLWDLKLLNESPRDTGFDLDTVAKTINTELKSVTEGSFVETKSNPRKAELQTKLEVVKHIISVKLNEEAAAKKRTEMAAQRRKLLDILANKEEQELSNMSKEDILKKLEELGN